IRKSTDYLQVSGFVVPVAVNPVEGAKHLCILMFAIVLKCEPGDCALTFLQFKEIDQIFFELLLRCEPKFFVLYRSKNVLTVRTCYSVSRCHSHSHSGALFRIENCYNAALF